MNPLSGIGGMLREPRKRRPPVASTPTGVPAPDTAGQAQPGPPPYAQPPRNGRKKRGGEAPSLAPPDAAAKRPLTPGAPGVDTDTLGRTDRAKADRDTRLGTGSDPELNQLRDKIKQSHRKGLKLDLRTEELARQRIEQDAVTGRLLIELKRKIGHGNWEAWVETQCGIKPRTARDYMTIAERWDEVQRLIDPDRRPAADLIRLSRKWILKKLASPSVGKGPEPAPGAMPDVNSSGSGHTRRRPQDGEVDADGNRRADDKPANARPARPSRPAEPRQGDSSQAAPGAHATPHPEEEPGPDHHLASPSRQADDEGPVALPDEKAPEPASTSEADGEDLLDDAAWLEGLATWTRLEQLRNTAVFREEALLWRRLRPAIEHLHRIHRPSPDDIKAAGVMSWIRERYAYRVAVLTGVKHPGEWPLCSRCGGSGRSNALAKHCDPCKGAGYQVAHESDPAAGDQGADPEGD